VVGKAIAVIQISRTAGPAVQWSVGLGKTAFSTSDTRTMQIQIEVPDELALRLSSLQDQLPQILELGLREWKADGQSGFSGLSEVLEFLANIPSPEEILALKPSEALQQYISDLLEKIKPLD